MEQVEERANVVIDRLVHQYFKSNYWFTRWFAKFILGRKQNDVVEFAQKMVKSELTKMKLMR